MHALRLLNFSTWFDSQINESDVVRECIHIKSNNVWELTIIDLADKHYIHVL